MKYNGTDNNNIWQLHQDILYKQRREISNPIMWDYCHFNRGWITKTRFRDCYDT